jgi:hypothetical protein
METARTSETPVNTPEHNILQSICTEARTKYYIYSGRDNLKEINVTPVRIQREVSSCLSAINFPCFLPQQSPTNNMHK